MKKYLVGVLYYGPLDREHDHCMRALKNHPLVHAVSEMHGCPYIDIGRSTIATAVLDNPDLGGLLFIDHDILFDFEEVTKVLESVEKSKGVVGGGYSMRRPGAQMIGGIDSRKVPEGENVVFFDGGKSWPAAYLGMGFTAIHRTVLERLVKAADEKQALQADRIDALERCIKNGQKTAALEILDSLLPEFKGHALPRLKSGITDADVIPFFSLLQRMGSYYGEDVSFCLRATDENIPVEMDTRVRLYHKGTYTYGLEDCGMVIPYCSTLVSVKTDLEKPNPRPSNVSPNAAIQAALDEQALEAELAQHAAAGREPFPKTEDPLQGAAE